MFGSRIPYTGGRHRRQSPNGAAPGRQAPPFLRAAAIAAIALSAAGCGRIGLPTAQSIDPIRTGSINASVTDPVDPSDWEVVRQTIASMSYGSAADSRAWQNPRTGSYGTLEAKSAVERSGAVCRPFATTVADLRGVRRYRGEACRPEAGSWQLTGIIPDDSKLL